ncbi:hypothetical protein [Actinoplanes flavus]|uniref:DUF4440 domain-containing protein n=1 Tax=Actinoplanes flavus TaxID=2820290 RepID=A0ABS3UZB5_9ACTN|nr:hypothetical protein [Actinoplanes flavus]MBO3743917.1 hypothetical protein [Actinoplanes flavus]
MRTFRWSLAAAGLLASTACTPAAPATDAASSAPALPPDVDAAYQEFWATWQAAMASPDYDVERLGARVGDPLLETLQTNLRKTREQHVVTRGQATHQIRQVEADGGAWWVTDCVGIGGWQLYDAGSASPIAGQADGPRSQLTMLVLRRQDGAWKATNMYDSGVC